MANILINGTLAPNGPFQIINTTDAFGAVQTFTNNTARDAWLTAHASNAVAGMWANVFNTGGATSITYQLQNDLATWTPVASTNAITQITGDLAAGPGPGSVAGTLATVNANVGSFGDATHVGTFTVNAKGLVTAASSTAITFPVSGLANPTASIGLTAVNGSATTALRSDGAPALSQAITPTWSNVHTFSAGLITTSVDAAAALNIGASTATSINIGGNGNAVTGGISLEATGVVQPGATSISMIGKMGVNIGTSGASNIAMGLNETDIFGTTVGLNSQVSGASGITNVGNGTGATTIEGGSILVATHAALIQISANSLADTVVIDGTADTITLTTATIAALTIDNKQTAIFNGHLATTGTTPGIAIGAGAGGTGASAAITGTDIAGYISVTLGLTPSASGTVVTVTFANTYTTAPRMILITPANTTAALLSGVNMVFVNQAGITATTFAITAGTTALTTGSPQWYYHVIR